MTLFPSQSLCVSECVCHLMPGGQKQLNLHREVALSIKDLLLGLNHWYSQAAKACRYIRSLLFNELCLPALFSSWQALCPRRPILCQTNSFSTALDTSVVKITGRGSFISIRDEPEQKETLKYYNASRGEKKKNMMTATFSAFDRS